MSTTRRTLLAGGLAAAVSALLLRLPRVRPGLTGFVPLPEFGGPTVYRSEPWVAELRDVAGTVLGTSDGELAPRAEGRGLSLRFAWPAGTARGTVLEVVVRSPLGHEERRMISPLTIGCGDTLLVVVPLRLDGSVA